MNAEKYTEVVIFLMLQLTRSYESLESETDFKVSPLEILSYHRRKSRILRDVVRLTRRYHDLSVAGTIKFFHRNFHVRSHSIKEIP
jgi:hypothetical protein